MKKIAVFGLILAACLGLSACSSAPEPKKSAGSSRIFNKVQNRNISLADPSTVQAYLAQRQTEWKGTRYRLGGNSKRGIDCSGFTQLTFKELFGISLPRMTTEQAKVGVKVAKSDLQAGDLVFFNTGRGPNGKHVGIYVKDGQFLHASTKGGVIYSSLNSPYWSKAYWQARRL